MSPGFMPEAAIRMRTSPAPGVGSAISPTTNTSRAGPCLSYQAALIWKPRFSRISVCATLRIIRASVSWKRRDLLKLNIARYSRNAFPVAVPHYAQPLRPARSHVLHHGRICRDKKPRERHLDLREACELPVGEPRRQIVLQRGLSTGSERCSSRPLRDRYRGVSRFHSESMLVSCRVQLRQLLNLLPAFASLHGLNGDPIEEQIQNGGPFLSQRW